MYDPAKYRDGTEVRIVDRQALEQFFESWTLHHPLTREQLSYAGEVSTVLRSSMYHGGDVIYELIGAPGVWHERCLEPLQ